MIKKKFLKSRKATKVTFELPADGYRDADAVVLLAEFNGWQPVPFEQKKSGKWKLEQEVAPERRYQFRYQIRWGDRVEYLNDPDADAVVPNDQGTDNAVIAA